MSTSATAAITTQSYRPFVFPIVFFIIGISFYVFTIKQTYHIREKYVSETISEFGQLPSTGIQVASLEFKGVVSDYLFFRTMTYLGLRIGEKKNPSADEWQLIHQMLQRTTDLDPMFWDPYVFAEMMLGWQAGMLKEANTLLEKAAENRPEDYRPYFYIGFNYLYFKKDSINAAHYLRKAATYNNAPGYIKGLASRVSLYADQTSTGIFFLENIIQDTADPKLASYLEKRLDTLKRIFFLELKVKDYQKKNGKLPTSLEDLVTDNIITEIPSDPYGGEFFLLNNGRVYTTSEMVESY